MTTNTMTNICVGIRQVCHTEPILGAHSHGAYAYKRPPYYVPTMSNFFNDLMPFDFCCKWTPHCEFYFWRRQSSGSQEYKPPVLGFAYGEPHFITYDNQRYTFKGKGCYVLSMMKSPRHDLMIQVRMEQPPKTLWDTDVRATAITGLAARDNGSATVQVCVPGWWVWCRERPLETGLKWMTGILSAVGFVLILIIIFCCCYQRRVKMQKQQGTFHSSRRRRAMGSPPGGGFGYEPRVIPREQSDAFNVPVMEYEPGAKHEGKYGESSA